MGITIEINETGTVVNWASSTVAGINEAAKLLAALELPLDLLKEEAAKYYEAQAAKSGVKS